MKTPTAPTTMTRIVTACAALLVLAGCIPEKRVVWSHDGKRAAVVTDRGLRFIDEAGHVLKNEAGDAINSEPRTQVSSCTWLSDNKRLLVCHSADVLKWAQLSSILDDDQKTAVKKHATALRERALAYNGDWDAFALDPHNEIAPNLYGPVLMYLRDNLGEGLAEHVGSKWHEIANMSVKVATIQVFTLSETELTPGDTVVRCLGEVLQPQLAPNDKNVAIAIENVGIGVAPVQPNAKLRIVANTQFPAFGYDWSPDSRSLVFMRCTAAFPEGTGDDVKLGSLTTATLADENGKLLDKWEEIHDRIGMLYNPLTSAQWLSDGRIIFSAFEVTLPATSRDMPKRWTLFVWDPRMPASVSRAIGRDFDRPLEVDMPLFEISPDEKRVLLPGPDGRVILYNFVSGEATDIVSDDAPRGRTRMLATWKSNTEVCFTINPLFEEDKTTPGDVAVWKDGKTRILSKSWPEEMKHGWLTDK